MCREFLIERLGQDYEWLQQVQDGIEVYLHRCLTQFGTGTPTNGQAISSGADYKFSARTAAEIKETIAAEQGAVTAAKKGFKLTDDADRIAQREGLADPAAQLEPETAAPVARTIPPKAKPVIPEGWVL